MKCAWRPNFTFFGIFLQFINHFWKLLIWWSRKFYCSQQNNNFKKCLINSKKIPKNVKFGLQAHINMENKMNDLDRSFGLWMGDLWSNAQRCLCIAMHHSPSLSLSLSIYIYRVRLICCRQHFCPRCCRPFFYFVMSKQQIQTVRCLIYIIIYLETKFYIFLNFFTIY